MYRENGNINEKEIARLMQLPMEVLDRLLAEKEAEIRKKMNEKQAH